jgi:hypothetical protein
MTLAVKGVQQRAAAESRLTSETPSTVAARAVHVAVGLVALEPWLMELPWCSHRRR